MPVPAIPAVAGG